MIIFSMNGSGICTAERSSDSSRSDANCAPPIPSRPVGPPSSTTRSPDFARFLISSSFFPNPTAATSTREYPEYEESNSTSPPTVGIPRQFPYAAIPDTAFLKSHAACASFRTSPNRSPSSIAIGRVPAESMSRITPPTPVAAPPYGSIAEG